MNRFLPKSRLARNVMLLASGTAAGQLIVVAATPILTRLYTPDDFGMLAVYAAILSLLAAVASLRYELAIPLPESDEEALSILVLSVGVVLAMALLTAIAVFIFRVEIGNMLGMPKFSNYLWMVPLGVLLTGLYNVSNYWAVRTKNFKAIARTKFTQALAMVIVQLTAFRFGAPALLIGHAGGQSAGVGSLGLLALRVHWHEIRAVRWPSLHRVAKMHYRFPLFTTWSGLLNAMGAQAPNILFAVLFSPAAAGLYFLANRILSIPISVLGTAIGQAFFSSAAEAARTQHLYALTIKTVKTLTLIAIPILVIVVLFGERAFAIVLGGAWIESGKMAEWLILSVMAQFVTSPVGQILAIQSKQHIGLMLQALLLGFRVTGILLGYWLGGFLMSVMLFSVLGAAGYLCFLLVSVHYTRVSLHE